MSSKKKLLVTASTFPRWAGDTEPRFILDLCSHMTDDFDVTVLVPACPGAAEKEDLEGVHVIRYHYFPIHSWEILCYPGAIVPRIKQKKIRAFLVPFLFLALWAKVKALSSSYDVIHAHWLIPQGLVMSGCKTPYLLTGHGTDVTSLNRWPIVDLKKKCIRKASCVTAISQFIKSKELELVNRDDIHVISMGCDTSKFGPEHRIQGYWGEENKKTILFVGRLAKIKGVEYLIDAVDGTDYRLVIVGDGPERGALEERASKAKAEIIFAGAKSHDELVSIYASADVFVAPSITMPNGAQEGLGLVNLEAMSSGLVVIGSRSGGIKEIINDGVNGILVDEKNSDAIREAVDRVFNDSDFADNLRRNSAETIKEYDYSRIAERYVKCLNEILR